MRCGYCGRFMRMTPYDEWNEESERWNCSQQAAHIIADPEHWSVDSLRLGTDAVDTDGDPISGMVGAHRLTPEQLRIALGVSEPTEQGAGS